MPRVDLAPTVLRLLEARRRCNTPDFERALAELADLLGAEPPPDTRFAELETHDPRCSTSPSRVVDGVLIVNPWAVPAADDDGAPQA